jgi:MGT family glycosyltransferase
MSGKVLVLCEGIWLAHTARPLAIARALRAAGWEVEFGASGKYAALPASEGFVVHPLTTMDPEMALAQVRSARIGYNRRLVEEYVEDELTLIRRLKPDLVLNDFRLTLAISGRLSGVPFVNILNAYMTNYYAPVRRAPHDLFVTKIIGKRATSALMPHVMLFATRAYARPFSTVAAARGVAAFTNVFDVMESPFLNLVCELEDFMPVVGAPKTFKYIGPILWEPSVAAPEWLARIDETKPVIYFTMGSTGFAHYYEALKNAFGGTDFQVLITTGGSADAGTLPANFHVTELAPALAIIEKSDLVICHGGNGTIYQALSRGVSVLGIPTFHDQDFNMQRVEDLGVGMALYPGELSGATLRATAERLIGDAKVKAAATALGEKIRATDAPTTAVKYVSEMLDR